MEKGERRIKVSILSSKKLTPSFHKIQDSNAWQSITLSLEEAESVVSNAVKKLTPNSEPLTITITVND